MEEINKIPPVTRFLIFSTGIVTLPCLLAIVSPTHFVLYWPFILKKWQVWRLVSGFFYGGSGLPLLFDLFLLYRNSSDLEVNTFFRRTSEYAWALMLMGSVIIGCNYPLGSAVLFNPMLNALTYLWARANPTAKVSFFGVITVPAPYLPYAYLALDLIRGGPSLVVQSATGLVAGHAYYFLRDVLPSQSGTGGSRGRSSTIVQPPQFLQRLLPDSEDPALAGQAPATGGTSRSTGFGTAFAPRGRSFGDNGENMRGGNTLGSSSSSGSGSWIPSFFRGSSRSGSSGGNERDVAASRNALLEATERRLREQRNSSIAGRNQAMTSSSSTTPTTSLAGTSLSTDSKTSAIASRKGESSGSNEAVRRANASTSSSTSTSNPSNNSSGMLTFGQFASKEKERSKDEEHDNSSSGGAVAEQRRGKSGEEKSEGEKKGGSESVGYQWGGGNRLGD